MITILKCKENELYDVVQTYDGEMMYLGQYKDALDAINNDPSISAFVDLKKKSNEAWVMLSSLDENDERFDDMSAHANGMLYKMIGARTVLAPFYGREVLNRCCSVAQDVEK